MVGGAKRRCKIYEIDAAQMRYVYLMRQSARNPSPSSRARDWKNLVSGASCAGDGSWRGAFAGVEVAAILGSKLQWKKGAMRASVSLSLREVKVVGYHTTNKTNGERMYRGSVTAGHCRTSL